MGYNVTGNKTKGFEIRGGLGKVLIMNLIFDYTVTGSFIIMAPLTHKKCYKSIIQKKNYYSLLLLKLFIKLMFSLSNHPLQSHSKRSSSFWLLLALCALAKNRVLFQ